MDESRRLWVPCLIALAVGLAVGPAGFWGAGASAQVRSSAHYTVENEVVSGGGAAAASTDYSNVSTVAQTGTVGEQSGGAYDNQSGFWHALRVTIPVPALSAAGAGLLLMLVSWMIFRRRGIRGKEVS